LQEQWEKEDALFSQRNAGIDEYPKSSQQSLSQDQEAKDLEFARKLQLEEDGHAAPEAQEGPVDEPRTPIPSKGDEEIAIEDPTPKAEARLEYRPEWDTLIDELPFDTDPLTFDPEDYKTLIESLPDGRTTYSILTRAFVLINSTRSRIKIVDTLTNFLRTIMACDPESLLPAVWLTTNDIGPPYEQTELGIGGSVINKALLKVGGLDQKGLRTLYNKYGDAGDAAFEAKVKQRTLILKKPMPLSTLTFHQY
jgi:DNA ligase 1